MLLRTEVSVDAALAGERLDRALAASLPELSRSRVQALLRGGMIADADGTVSDGSRRVRPGERYTVDIPPPEPAEPEPQDIPLVVVHEDQDVIVVDKPAGMVVHPAPGSRDATLVNALLAHCGNSLSGIGGVRRPGIVHRIDKDTSGLLVVAKSDAAHASLSEQFAARTVQRTYRALVWGIPAPASGRIEGDIGRNPRDRKKMAMVRAGGRPAATRYRVLNRFGTVAAEVECRLETGRTHQIRVHMTSRGHPLVGDVTYGRGRRGGSDPLALALSVFPRQALHAETLGFIHPGTGLPLNFTAPLPADMFGLIAQLQSIEAEQRNHVP